MTGSKKISLESKETRLFLAVIVNIALTIAQVIGGLVSGSLSLISDAFTFPNIVKRRNNH